MTDPIIDDMVLVGTNVVSFIFKKDEATAPAYPIPLVAHNYKDFRSIADPVSITENDNPSIQ